MRISTRITLVQLGLLVLAFAVYGAVVLRREGLLFERDVARDQHAVAVAAAVALDRSWAEREDLVRSLTVGDDKLRIRLVGPGEFAERTTEERSAALAEHGEVNFDAGIEHITWRVVHTDPLMVVEVAENTTEERTYLVQSAWLAGELAVSLGALLAICTGLAGWLLVGRPVAALTRQAEAVGSGDFTTRLGWSRTDEFGALAAATDRMSSRLAQLVGQLKEEARRRTAAEAQLRHADRLTTVGTLAAGVAHELGTPLNVVQIRADMIRSGTVVGSAARDGARIIFEQVDRMTAIIKQLLRFARPATPRVDTVDLVAIAREIGVLLRPLADKRGCSIVLSESAEVFALADRDLLVQAAMNLAMNAIQASSSGGVVALSADVVLTARPDDPAGEVARWARLVVADQGAGIPAAFRERVFEPFFTTKPPGEGTGLGLSVTWGIIREQGGFLSVEDVAGGGACFAMHLPEPESR